MSTTVPQGGIYVIPPGGSELIAFPFDLPVGVTITIAADKALLRGSALASPLTLGTPTQSGGTVSVPVTSVTEGQLWAIKVTATTNEVPPQVFISEAEVLCETSR
jgi:hypothetical protein